MCLATAHFGQKWTSSDLQGCGWSIPGLEQTGDVASRRAVAEQDVAIEPARMRQCGQPSKLFLPQLAVGLSICVGRGGLPAR